MLKNHKKSSLSCFSIQNNFTTLHFITPQIHAISLQTRVFAMPLCRVGTSTINLKAVKHSFTVDAVEILTDSQTNSTASKSACCLSFKHFKQ